MFKAKKNPIISALHVPFPFREEFSRSSALIFRGGNLSFPHVFPAIKKSRKKKIFTGIFKSSSLRPDNDKCCFVAAMELGTLGAVTPDLFRKLLFGDLTEPESFEKGRSGGQSKKPPGASFLLKSCDHFAHKDLSKPFALKFRMDDHRAQLKQITAEIPECRTAADFSVKFSHRKVADEKADILFTAPQDDTLSDIKFKEIKDRIHILQRCGTNFY